MRLVFLIPLKVSMAFIVVAFLSQKQIDHLLLHLMTQHTSDILSTIIFAHDARKS